MITKMYTRWFAGAALGLALATSLAGGSHASAESLNANLSAVSAASVTQLSADGTTSVVAGAQLTVRGSSFAEDEYVGLWINIPGGVTVASRSLGQTDTEVADGVVGLDEM